MMPSRPLAGRLPAGQRRRWGAAVRVPGGPAGRICCFLRAHAALQRLSHDRCAAEVHALCQLQDTICCCMRYPPIIKTGPAAILPTNSACLWSSRSLELHIVQVAVDRRLSEHSLLSHAAQGLALGYGGQAPWPVASRPTTGCFWPAEWSWEQARPPSSRSQGRSLMTSRPRHRRRCGLASSMWCGPANQLAKPNTNHFVSGRRTHLAAACRES